MITVVIPAYNEEAGIEFVLSDLSSIRETTPEISEVIVVDDGSADGTADIVRECDVTLFQHEHNRGYGASLKSGIRQVETEWILILDADGTYPVEDVSRLIEHIDEYDMVVGARTGSNVSIPTYRRPAKALLNGLANYLSGSKVPDLNSGMRLFRREDAMGRFNILPSGFSFTTTITLAYETTDRFVKYVPIDYHTRDGESKINPFRDGMNFVFLILRTITYFNPMKVFLPVGVFLLLSSLFVFVYTSIVFGNFFDATTIILGVAGIQTILYGLLADLVVRKS